LGIETGDVVTSGSEYPDREAPEILKHSIDRSTKMMKQEVVDIPKMTVFATCHPEVRRTSKFHS
jgi:hypothetical protein